VVVLPNHGSTTYARNREKVALPKSGGVREVEVEAILLEPLLLPGHELPQPARQQPLRPLRRLPAPAVFDNRLRRPCVR
jgi:hypothetical protein